MYLLLLILILLYIFNTDYKEAYAIPFIEQAEIVYNPSYSSVNQSLIKWSNLDDYSYAKSVTVLQGKDQSSKIKNII